MVRTQSSIALCCFCHHKGDEVECENWVWGRKKRFVCLPAYFKKKVTLATDVRGENSTPVWKVGCALFREEVSYEFVLEKSCDIAIACAGKSAHENVSSISFQV